MHKKPGQGLCQREMTREKGHSRSGEWAQYHDITADDNGHKRAKPVGQGVAVRRAPSPPSQQEVSSRRSTCQNRSPGPGGVAQPSQPSPSALEGWHVTPCWGMLSQHGRGEILTSQWVKNVHDAGRSSSRARSALEKNS